MVRRLWIGDGRRFTCVWLWSLELHVADTKYMRSPTSISKLDHWNLKTILQPWPQEERPLISSKPSLMSMNSACYFSASEGFRVSEADADVVNIVTKGGLGLQG